MTTKQKDELEQLIDKASLSTVLFALADICDEKANHIRENWQDNGLAKLWDAGAWEAKKAASKCEV